MDNYATTMNYYGTLMIINKYSRDKDHKTFDKYIHEKEFIGTDIGYLILRHSKNQIIKNGFLAVNEIQTTARYNISVLAFTYTMTCHDDLERINKMMIDFNRETNTHNFISSGNTDEDVCDTTIQRFYQLKRKKNGLGFKLNYDTLNGHVPNIETVQKYYRPKYGYSKHGNLNAMLKLYRMYGDELTLETSFDNIDKLPTTYKFLHEILECILPYVPEDIEF